MTILALIGVYPVAKAEAATVFVLIMYLNLGEVRGH